MTDDVKLKKTLEKITTSENGWRRVLATAEGSFSRELASKNLLRLDAERKSLLAEIENMQVNR